MSALGAVRGAYGACQLLDPPLLAGRVLHLRLSGAAAVVVRVLGARHLLQAIVSELAVGSGASRHPLGVLGLRALTAVDFLHAASMVALALGSRRWRTAAAADAVVATLFGLAQARTTTPGNTRKGRI